MKRKILLCTDLFLYPENQALGCFVTLVVGGEKIVFLNGGPTSRETGVAVITDKDNVFRAKF